MTLSCETCEKKTSITPGKGYEKTISSIQISSWKFASNFELTQG